MITPITDSKVLSAFPDSLSQWMKRRSVTLCEVSRAPWSGQCHPPVRFLFVQGNYEILNEIALAVVGTRRASRDGAAAAFEFSAKLSYEGIHIVSGLALGIDSYAHFGALRGAGKGKTIAVLGSGLENIYPRENIGLAEEIVKSGGCVVSEYAPHVGPRKLHFPQRNRIVAGLSKAVFVVEAPLKSGALITARLARDLGREVFALAGKFSDPGFQGNHLLIQQGAQLVQSPQIIFEQMMSELSSYLPHGDFTERQRFEIVSLAEWQSAYAGEFNELVAMIQLKCSQGEAFEVAPQLYLRQGAKELARS